MVFSVRVAAAVSMATLGVLGSHQLLQQRRMAAARTAVRNTDTCVHTLVDASGTSHTFDFRAAAALPDVTVQDNVGHTYTMAMCRNATARCLPKGWNPTTTQGNVIMSWGSVPECEKACVDPLTGLQVCCTKDCSTLGLPFPMRLAFINPSQPGSGLRATFPGVMPSSDDPFWCPWNPSTGAQYPQTATIELKCDPAETFKLVSAAQNSTENCAHLLTVRTTLACVDAPPTPGAQQCNPNAAGGCSADVCPECCKPFIT